MSYNASVINIMIASPSDVPTERQNIKDIILEWNFLHSEGKKIVLMPLAWESHASPKLGAPAQEIINKQLLNKSDLLIAVFWTRLGSPTTSYPSGTMEEIDKHVNSKKPVMLYFSNTPVTPDSIDETQYKALKEAKEKYKKLGLIEIYDSIEDFRTKLTRQLTLTINREFSSTTEENENINNKIASLPDFSSLSTEEIALLINASEDKNGTIISIRTLQGLIVQTNNKTFNEIGIRRSEALWENAIKNLVGKELLEPTGKKNEFFKLTHSGYEVADKLKLIK